MSVVLFVVLLTCWLTGGLLVGSLSTVGAQTVVDRLGASEWWVLVVAVFATGMFTLATVPVVDGLDLLLPR